MATTAELTSAGAILLGLDHPAPSLLRTSWQTILLSRLSQFASSTASWPSISFSAPPETAPESALRLLTANYAAALLVLYSTAALDEPSPPSTSTTASPPHFGAKDNKVISMLAGIVGHWGLGSKLPSSLLPSSYSAATKKKKTPQKIEEVVEDEEEQDEVEAPEELDRLVKSVLQVVLLRQGESKASGRGQLASLVLPQLLLPLMAALVFVVHGRVEEGGSDWAEDGLARLTRMNTPVTVISTLITLLSTLKSTPLLKPAISNLLSAQLLRPTGVRSLLIVVIGNDEDVMMPKLDMLCRLLGAKPDSMGREAFFNVIVPQLLSVLQASADSALSAPKSTRPPPPPPIPIVRAAAYVLATLLMAHPALFSHIHDPLTIPPSSIKSTSHSAANQDDDGLDPILLAPAALLRPLLLISTLILQAPPLPNLLDSLVHPVLPFLLKLSSYLLTPSMLVSESATLLSSETSALLATYGKSTDLAVLLKTLPRAMTDLEAAGEVDSSDQGAGWYFARTSDGDVCVRAEVQPRDESELAVSAEGIVEWLKEVGRKELSAAMFLRWLGEVRVLKSESGGLIGAKRALLRLQLVAKMTEEMGADILTDPKEIIEFVAHVLDPAETEEVDEEDVTAGAAGGLAGLKISQVDEGEGEEEVEEPGLEGLGKGGMILTALTLLLAVLEANEDLNMQTTPLLGIVYTHLDTLASESISPLVPPLAREARLVLSARRASTIPSSSSSKTASASRTLYLSALKLLQDPLLPVRAQGLAQLRQLVNDKEADAALLPAILDIFIQAVEDDDSFLYLSAVQGLSEMVDKYGRQMVLRLVEVYVAKGSEVGSGDKGRRELDKRLRMGEALVQVIQRAGTALAVFVDNLVPSLLLVLRTSLLPTPLRSSSLTILATCVETAPLALLPYVADLADACLTLLSVESRPMSRRPATPPPFTPTSRQHGDDDDDDSDDDFDLEEDEEETQPQLDRHGKLRKPEETPNPTAVDPKHPALRRSALLFLALLFRERTAKVVPSGVRSRARTVVGYVGATDEDALVRHQAGEVLEDLTFSA